MQIKISAAVAENIQGALAAVDAARLSRDRAQTARSEKGGQQSDDQYEIERLEKSLGPDDAEGITRLAQLRTKLPLYDRLLTELDCAAAAAERTLEEARGRFDEAVAAAAREIEARRKAALVKVIEPLEDPQFARWCAERGPSVCQAENFARNPGAAEQQLRLSLEEVAKIIIAGGIPNVHPPEVPTAGLIAVSNSPARQMGAPGATMIVQPGRAPVLQ